MELINYIQWIIAVRRESFKPTLFAVRVQVFLARSDLWWWSEVRFQIKVFKTALQKNRLLELSGCEGGGAARDAALALPRRVSSKTFTSYSPWQCDSSRSGFCEISAAMVSCAGLELSASPVSIFVLTGVLKQWLNYFWSLLSLGGHITRQSISSCSLGALAKALPVWRHRCLQRSGQRGEVNWFLQFGSDTPFPCF